MRDALGRVVLILDAVTSISSVLIKRVSELPAYKGTLPVADKSNAAAIVFMYI